MCVQLLYYYCYYGTRSPHLATLTRQHAEQAGQCYRYTVCACVRVRVSRCGIILFYVYGLCEEYIIRDGGVRVVQAVYIRRSVMPVDNER